MGVCLTYTAVRDGDPNHVCESLGLRRTCEFGDLLDARIAGISLQTNWYVVGANWFWSTRFCKDAVLSALSADVAVLSCFLEEHVMYSSLKCWQDGEEKWSVTHDCNFGLAHLERTGAIPSKIAELADEFIAKQMSEGGDKARVDYVFDVPVVAMDHYTGIRRDRSRPEHEGKFETLEPIRVSFLQRISSLFRPTN